MVGYLVEVREVQFLSTILVWTISDRHKHVRILKTFFCSG